MRILFGGTPEFAKVQLQALLDASMNIVGVYTQPDRPSGRGQQLMPSPVKALAQLHNIPIEQPLSLKNPQAVETFAHYQADVFIVAAYGLILPQTILNLPPFGCINVHASLLPRWRGASPIQSAILSGDKETGITLMRMDVGLDTGNILAMASCPLSQKDTSASLHDTLAILGAQLLVEKLPTIIHEKGQVQDPLHATYAQKITKSQAHINWRLPAKVIERQIRAFNPWPIAFCKIGEETVRLWQAEVVPLHSNAAPGTIVSHTDNGIIVATQQEGLLITHAQLPGKKMLPMKDILKSRASLFALSQCLS